jgi:hypothetical protein
MYNLQVCYYYYYNQSVSQSVMAVMTLSKSGVDDESQTSVSTDWSLCCWPRPVRRSFSNNLNLN